MLAVIARWWKPELYPEQGRMVVKIWGGDPRPFPDWFGIPEQYSPERLWLNQEVAAFFGRDIKSKESPF